MKITVYDIYIRRHNDIHIISYNIISDGKRKQNHSFSPFSNVTRRHLQTETKSDANEGAQEKSTICTPVKEVVGDNTLQNSHPFASLEKNNFQTRRILQIGLVMRNLPYKGASYWTLTTKRYVSMCVSHTNSLPCPKLSRHTNDPEMSGMDPPPHTTQATPVVLLCPPCIRRVSNLKPPKEVLVFLFTCPALFAFFMNNGELTSTSQSST